MKKIKIAIFLTTTIITILPAVTVLAQYTLLEPLPDFSGGEIEEATLSEYLAWAFRFMLALAGILAVLMLVFGGIMYAASGGNASRAEQAKSRITSAILGLILAIAAWLILYTVNPDLVNLGLNIPKICWPTACS